MSRFRHIGGQLTIIASSSSHRRAEPTLAQPQRKLTLSREPPFYAPLLGCCTRIGGD
ncbi:MAG: hypothetical protein AAGI09_14475 [Pseudomonadota bacterium]